jgi:PAS domain S-box-containing protein
MASSSRPLRLAVRLLWIAGGGGLAILVVGTLADAGGVPTRSFEAFGVCLYLVPAASCFLRAATVRSERFAWSVFGIGMLASAAGWASYYLVQQDLAAAPYPSLADALRLTGYAASVVGLLALMRSRVERLRDSSWIDAAVGGLAIAAVVASPLVEPVLVSTGGRLAAVVTGMAYPIFDLLAFSVVLAVFLMTDWRPGWAWLLFGGIYAFQGLCDTIYLDETANGTFHSHSLLTMVWPGCDLLIAIAAWQAPAFSKASRTGGWRAVALTPIFALVGLGLTVYDHWHHISDAALVLATLTLIVAFVRTAMTFGEMRSLAHRGAQHMELILNGAGEGICGLDRAGLVTFANPEATALTGWESSAFVGRHFHETVHHSRPDGSPYPFQECPVAGCLLDGIVHHGDEDVYWHKDGSSFPVEFTSTPVLDESGVAGAVVVFKNVAERKASQAALAASERQTRAILETANDAFLATNADGVITDWNPRAEALFGWSRDDALGRGLAETILPERFREAHRLRRERFVATGMAEVCNERVEIAALHRDGHEFPVERTVSVSRTEDGWSFNSFAQDITARKAAEALLERQRQQLIEAQSVGGFGSWEWDIARNTIEWSDELCRIYGIEPTDCPRTLEEVVAPTHPDDRAMYAAHVQASLEGGEPLAFEFRFIRPDGAVRIVESRGDVVRDEDGKPIRMVGTGQDITERYELERAKDEFTSVVSHELRTPLTSIRGSLGLLASGVLGELPAQGQRMVEIAVQNTDRLVRLINDILDIERINSGQIDMHPSSCDSRELVARATESVASIAADARVTVVTDVVPVRLRVDGDRMIQTLTNLIGNAVKFSPAGSSVRISCSRRDDQVLFEVADHGRGIPAANIDSIFDRFGQVDASDSRQNGGTGLGLAICRSIVEQHGGRIWAQSTLGEGALFSFLLPAPLTEDVAPGDPEDARGPVVLVCDDDACVIEVARAVLEQRGYRVLTASCGEQAIERAIERRPDAILLDLLMPGMSGWETAAELKRRPETEHIPIVILSVLAQAETDSPAGAIVDWVQKPLDDAQLFAALEKAVGCNAEPFKVLVVEDDHDLAGVLTAMFERHGIETFHAATGTAAIEISQRVLPDLLVLDLGLPEIDGFEVVEWLRRHDRLHAVPMVVYTARDLDETDRDRLRLGSTTQFLTKARITPADFERRVVALLGRRTTSDPREVGHELEAHPAGR